MGLSFARTTPITEQPTFDHGYTIEQVDELKLLKKAIELRNLGEQPVTLKEFKEIVVPWNRAHRGEQFVLFAEKKATTKEKKPRVAKPKKLTKKAIQDRLNDLIFKKATGKDITEEEQAFVDEQFKLAGALL